MKVHIVIIDVNIWNCLSGQANYVNFYQILRSGNYLKGEAPFAISLTKYTNVEMKIAFILERRFSLGSLGCYE